MTQAPDQGPDEQRGPTIRDKRRIDPNTYEVREPQATAAPAAEEPVGSPRQPDARDEELAKTRTDLAERTADLQRLQAEYVNYKRRVDRDRDVSRVAGVESVLKDLLNVVDDIRSAREHEELTGGFKAVAEEVERVTAKYGLESYGSKGDAFDPHIHEALLHMHTDGITGPTCVEILQPGYRIKDKIIRPARVAVAEPDPNAPVIEPVDETSDAPEAGADDTAAGD
ncbi:nucleotide exchange factor GrpE [Microlunatus ginsengisoli]|uniref:Protein GrpE n=1 Tax=Microlunatus ginsengisoli TaxID=363863 RepID=A0ABP7A5D3_9ACTN